MIGAYALGAICVVEEGSRTRTDIARELGISGTVVSDRCKQLGIKLRYKQALSPGQLAEFYELHRFLENPPDGYQRALPGFHQYKADLESGAVKDTRAVQDLETKLDLFKSVVNSLEREELQRFARSFSPFIFRDFLEKGLQLRWGFTPEEVGEIFEQENLDTLESFEPLPGYLLVRRKERWYVKSLVKEGRDKGRKLQSQYERDLLSMREDWSGVELTGGLLPSACFDNNNFEDAILTGCVLVASSFHSANLCHADLSLTILSRSTFTEAVADYLLAEKCSAIETSWERASLTQAVFRQSNFADSSFLQAILTGADLSNGNFEGCIFKGAGLSNANLRGANFQGSDLQEANLNGAKLDGTIFTNAKM